MSQVDGPRYGLDSLDDRQRRFAERFLSSAHGHAVLAAPLGMGKARTAGEIATKVATNPSRVLIVAPIAVGRAITASARDAGVLVLELSKARLRQLSADGGAAMPEAVIAYMSPQALADPWVDELFGRLRWDLVIADRTAVSGQPELAALIERWGARALFLSEGTDPPPIVWQLPDVEMYVLQSDLLVGEHYPAPKLEASFEPVPWDRDDREVHIIEMIEGLLARALPDAQALGLHRLRTAAASSTYALQAATLSLLDRIRDERNVAMHLGPKRGQEHLFEAVRDDALLVEIYAQLEGLAIAIDELDIDSKQDAFMRLAAGSTASDQEGGIVVFCAFSATADYVANGLRSIQRYVVRPSSGRPEQDEVEWALRQPGNLVVVHDAALSGLDLRSAHQAINYDFVVSPRRMHMRWSRLDWSAPSDLRIWTLVAGATASPVEHVALERVAYLAGRGSAQLGELVS